MPKLPRSDIPAWLRDVEVDAHGRIATPFVAREVLARSVYYPASGLDGNPLERLGSHVASFAYADYDARYDVESVRADLRSVTGYRVLGDRLLSPDEVDVHAWTHAAGPGATLGPPYALWTVLERSAGFDARHGPPRLSLLFLRADGVATYEGLYAANALAPEVLVIVHPGTAFGGNWTDFTDPHGPLCAAVLRAGRRAPTYLYTHARRGAESPWPTYDHHVATLHAGADLHLWARRGP